MFYLPDLLENMFITPCGVCCCVNFANGPSFSVTMSLCATSGIIFANEFVGPVKDGSKTQTVRMWSETAYKALCSAVEKGKVVPARSNWNNNDVFGYLICWEVKEICLSEITSTDIAREGVGEMTTADFLAKYFNGVAIDSSRVLREDKLSVVFRLRFKLVQCSKEELPECIDGLKWDAIDRHCCVCNLTARNHTCRVCER